jgi:hypothetical protein
MPMAARKTGWRSTKSGKKRTKGRSGAKPHEGSRRRKTSTQPCPFPTWTGPRLLPNVSTPFRHGEIISAGIDDLILVLTGTAADFFRPMLRDQKPGMNWTTRSTPLGDLDFYQAEPFPGFTGERQPTLYRTHILTPCGNGGRGYLKVKTNEEQYTALIAGQPSSLKLQFKRITDYHDTFLDVLDVIHALLHDVDPYEIAFTQADFFVRRVERPGEAAASSSTPVYMADVTKRCYRPTSRRHGRKRGTSFQEYDENEAELSRFYSPMYSDDELSDDLVVLKYEITRKLRHLHTHTKHTLGFRHLDSTPIPLRLLYKMSRRDFNPFKVVRKFSFKEIPANVPGHQHKERFYRANLSEVGMKAAADYALDEKLVSDWFDETPFSEPVSQVLRTELVRFLQPYVSMIGKRGGR